MRKSKTFLSFCVIYVIINMVLFPALYMKQTLNGISAWAFNVLPSVLPFLFFVKVLTSLGLLDKLSKVFEKPCQKLFKSPAISSLVFFSSIISGYPVGAKMTADCYQSGKISKSDAFKMCSFCSTSGPMFIIGAVGISMLGSPKFGYIIFIAHILGALINGLLYRNIKVKDDEIKSKKDIYEQSSLDISSIVLDSLLSILMVGAIIAIFFVVITSLSPIFNLFPPHIASVLEGTVEITRGCLDISTAFKGIWAPIACTFVISFGGISTMLQSITMLSKIKMPISLFCLQKFTHACTSTLIALLLVLII